MKKILLAGIAVAAFCAPAFAADMPVRAPVYKAAPAPMFSWTGCYLGAHAGYGWGKDNNGFGNAVFDGDFAPELGPYNQRTSGGLAGGQLGCNYQGPTNWVVGLEGELSWSGVKGSLTTPEDGADPGTFTRFQTRNRWDGDVAVRLGYAMDRSLLFGKVGAAWGNFRYTETHDDFPTIHACALCSVNINGTRAGLLLGAGWEYALQNNWTVKVEYNYINYGSHTIPYPSTGGSATSFPVHDTENVIKVGVNYLFSSSH
jgi:outer membrane immunogenic protein